MRNLQSMARTSIILDALIGFVIGDIVLWAFVPALQTFLGGWAFLLIVLLEIGALIGMFKTIVNK